MTNIYERARQGLPLENILIIDCHNHLGAWKAFNIPNNSAEGMLAGMDALGIDKACLTAHASIGPDYIYGNNLVIDALKHYPDRFIGYTTVNPNYEEDMKNELNRCFKMQGMRGIKLHPSCHGAPIDDKRYQIAFEAADEKGCPVLIHVWGKADVAAIDRLSSQYPRAQFIMGHAGAEIKAMEDAINVVNRRDNVSMDLALSHTYQGNVEWFVHEAGSKKVLFGTDMPFFDPRPAFGRVAMADISENEKKDIFGLNMQRLLGLDI